MLVGHGNKQSRKQEQAIAALISESTVEAAATKAGVGYRTLLNWLANADFQRAYARERRRIVDHAVSQVQRICGVAVTALKRNLECGTPAVEVSAARAVLDFALRAVEVQDLAARIEELEQAAKRRAA
jgi:hypothetical protein